MQFLVIDGHRVFRGDQPDRAAHAQYRRSSRDAITTLGQIYSDYDLIGELWLGDNLADGQSIMRIVDLLTDWSPHRPLPITHVYAYGARAADIIRRLTPIYGIRRVHLEEATTYLAPLDWPSPQAA